MSDRLLFIGWRESSRGREERALEVLDDAIALCGKMQEEGRIERFQVALMGPNGDLGGYVTIHGSAEQIAGVQADDEFRQNTVEAALCVDGFRHIVGFENEGAAAQLALYRDAVGRVPHLA